VRDAILARVDGEEIRQKVLTEFGIDLESEDLRDLRAVRILKNAFCTYSDDIKFRHEVTQLYDQHQIKLVGILATKEE
jgi:hypothetical protein